MKVSARLEHREGPRRDSRLGKDKRILTGEATVIMAKGGKIRVDMRDGSDHLATIIIDGKTISEWDIKQDRWTQYPVSWRQEDSFRPLLLVRTPFWEYYVLSWVDDDGPYRKWITNTQSKGAFKAQTVEAIEGQSCRMLRYDLSQEIDTSTFTETGFFAFDESTLLPARIEVTSTVHGVDAEGSTRLFSADTQQFIYHEVIRDVAVSDDTFTFHPRPGSQFVDPDWLRPKDALEGKSAPKPVEIRTLDGKTLLLSDFVDKKPVLLLFWATWCTPCKLELVQFQQLRKEYGKDRLGIIAISLDESLTPVRAYLDKHDFSYTFAHDPGGRMGKVFGLKGPPVTVLVDRKGMVTKVWRAWGEGLFEPLRKKVKDVLSRTPS